MANRLWELRNAPRGGVDAVSPKSGFPRFIYLLKTHFWKFAGLNLIFIAFCIPVATIPAALCGVNRVCMKLIREGNVFLWQEFWSEFRSSFKNSLVLGLLFGFLLFAGYYCMSLGLTNAALPLWSLLFWVLGIAATLAGLSWGAFAFAMMPLLPLRNRDILKNACLLCMLKPARALAAAGIVAGMAFLAAVLFPLSSLLLALNWMALAQFAVCFIVNSPTEEYIIGPYEAQERGLEK